MYRLWNSNYALGNNVRIVFNKFDNKKEAGYREFLRPAFPFHIRTSGTFQNLFHGIKQQTENTRNETIMK